MMIFKEMTIKDLNMVASFYISYYNENEGGSWTYEKVYKRIRQVFLIDDSYCLLQYDNKDLVGFLIGYIKEYDDLRSYFLEEIVISKNYQGKGYGSSLIKELEDRLVDKDVSLIELISVNDDKHHKFYRNLSFGQSTNLIMMSKFIN